MKKEKIYSLIILCLGFTISGLAMFASSLGLDRNGGWGKARIGLLLLGGFIALMSPLYFKYAYPINSVSNKIKIALQGWSSRYFAIPIVVVVIVIYIWFASSGRWTFWISHTYYYDGLAKSFLSGHLYLPQDPDPKLLELSNPYKKSERVKAKLETPVDVSLYKGKYYIYWGPVPALMLSMVYLFYDTRVGDLMLAFVFVSGMFFIQTLLIHQIWRCYFKDLPRWTMALSILVVGLVGPLVLLRHTHGNARIYEASIAGAQFFLMCGLLAAFVAINKPGTSKRRLAMAGILWTCAIGTRQTAAAPIGFMVVLLLWRIFKAESAMSKKVAQMISLGAPLFLGFVILAWYNWARFGSLTETGLYYQLAGWDIQEHMTELFSPIYVFQNIYNYFFNPVDLKPVFPFLFIRRGTEVPILLSSLPEIYNVEAISGLLYLFPFIIFAIAPLIRFFVGYFTKEPSQGFVVGDDQQNLNGFILGLGGSFAISFGLLAMFFWAGMRYTGDFMPSLTMLSVIGFWQGYQSISRRPLTTKLYTIFALILAGLSILMGVLLLLSTDTGLVKKIIGL